MAKQSNTAIPLKNWCANPYQSARDAILRVDLAATGDPEQANNIFYTAWTAIVIFTQGRGVPDPRWLPEIALFHKLEKADLERIKEAMEMRMRAVERERVGV